MYTTRLSRPAGRPSTPLLLVLAGCTVFCRAPARAGQPDLSSTLQMHRVVPHADGSEALQAATGVAPGDVLQYASVFSNSGQRPVQRLHLRLPIRLPNNSKKMQTLVLAGISEHKCFEMTADARVLFFP